MPVLQKAHTTYAAIVNAISSIIITKRKRSIFVAAMCRVRRINDAAVWRQCQPARHYYHGTLCVCVYDDNVSMDRLGNLRHQETTGRLSDITLWKQRHELHAA